MTLLYVTVHSIHLIQAIKRYTSSTVFQKRNLNKKIIKKRKERKRKRRKRKERKKF